ncbi:MAG: isoleucine--tRNA ligase, partial [Cyclobacteriaceae bacterium]|nr:isoleucine--tRNA ligase [Cyclobacteriaceae bacterium]
IAGLDQEAISRFEIVGSYPLNLNGESITLSDDDLLIQSEDIPGWTVATEGGITVALDINITDELQKEGIARDLVNRIQNLRKDLGMDVQDKIKILVDDENQIVTDSIQDNHEYICEETQAFELDVIQGIQNYKEMEIDDLIIKLNIQVLKPK